MRVNHKWRCVFSKGKAELIDAEGFRKDCLSLDGKEGYLAVIPYRKIKTPEQGKYYRGVVVRRFAEFWGCTNDEAHEALSFEHLKYKPNPNMPFVIKSTRLSEWGTVEWEEYMEFLRMWGAKEFGIYIELPNEVDFDSLPNIYH